jgi:hypothetical protein
MSKRDPYYRKKDYAGYIGALVICAICLGVVMWAVKLEKDAARADFMAKCETCHYQTIIIKTAGEFKAVHNHKKQDAHTQWLRVQIAKEMAK